jgi:hypothetical protein
MVLSVGLVTFIAWRGPPLDALLVNGSLFYFPSTIVQVIGLILVIGLFFIFPDGRFVPRWTRWLMPVMFATGILWIVFPSSPLNLANPYDLSFLSFVLLMGAEGLGIGAQIYRFMRVATPVQRQQTKWALSGVAISMLGYLAFGVDRFALPVVAESRMAGIAYELIGVPIVQVTMMVVPVFFAYAIIKHRLYEIDLLINRSLVYGSLTAILGGTYIAAIGLSQRLFVAFTGEKSDAAIVLTTLVVASVFTPVRSGLQHFFDRRFKETAESTRGLKAVSSQVSAVLDVVDTERLIGRLLHEAVHAFNAAGGAVYLGEDGRYHLVHVAGEWDQLEGMTAWLEADGVRYGWVALGSRFSGDEYSLQDQAELRK